ncbi:Molybdopterin synthase sulfur carrier subunit [hydrothermal vent metagenome]|uniref:Molybdopterin synthase sulfur carrier subunit n=1 Tax=hydrothermal vent metagenome TaxID=652676 RepID=A0A3B1A525_9ZZZZ
MSIEVKFFASLRERVGKASDSLEAKSASTVLQVWQQSVGESSFDTNILAAVNMEYVDAEHAVCDGDEVAFFPPVTGG